MNWPLIEQRRVAAGITRAQLIARVGANRVTGPRRLWHDDDHDTVVLGMLEKLCTVLDLHPLELFTPPSRRVATAIAARAEHPHRAALSIVADTVAVADTSGHGTAAVTAPADTGLADTTEADSAVIEAAVADLPAPVTLDQLADALGWTLGRALAAVEALDERLEPTGLRLDRDGDRGAGPR